MDGGIRRVLLRHFIRSIESGTFILCSYINVTVCLYEKLIKSVKFFNCSVPFIRDGLITTSRFTKNKLNSAKPLENMKILEIGCGAGILTEV